MNNWVDIFQYVTYISLNKVLEIPGQTGPLRYDAEWLCILRRTRHLESNSQCNSCAFPVDGELSIDQDEIDELIEEWQSDLRVPENFVQTAPPFEPNAPHGMLTMYENPQTVDFLKKLFGDEGIKKKDKLALEDFTGKPSSEAKSESSDEEAAPPATEAGGGDQRPLATQTSAGRTIKRRNASLYTSE